MTVPELTRGLALICQSLKPEQADLLLDGLVPTLQEAAKGQLQSARELDSAHRKARVLRTFGTPPDFPVRLRVLRESIPEPLDVSLESQLPTRWRRGMDVMDEGPRARRVLAGRLIRELLR